MARLVKRNSLFLSVFTLVIVALFLYRNAFSFNIGAISFFQKTTDAVINKLSSFVYYLIMQKKYLVDGYTDPNSYNYTLVNDNKIKNINVNKNVDIEDSIDNKLLPIPEVKNISLKDTTVINNASSGILNYTNMERQKLSLKALTANVVLDNIASGRIDDFFANQYFDHTSPDNKSLLDLVKRFNYNYTFIGENLAKGNFPNDQAIVEAWMNSPGHRANILNGKYKELGVAIKNGVLDGEPVTLAVQIFGSPLANCKLPSVEIKYLIDTSIDSVAKMQSDALVMYNNLNAIKNSPGLDISYYNQKVQEYNYLAKKVNEATINLKNMTDEYNVSVNNYNLCIKK